MRDLSLRALREGVALVAGAELFEGTVSENLRLARSHIGPAQARVALDAVGLWDEIAVLPQGLETKLQSGGAPLSSGQAARLVVARALAQRPRVMVVDGLLDGLSQRAVDMTLAALLGPWTLIVLTQRKEVAQRVGRVVLLDDGGSRA